MSNSRIAALQTSDAHLRRRRRRRARTRGVLAVFLLGVAVGFVLGGVRAAWGASSPPVRRAPAAWVASDFARCVRARESSNGRGSSNLYGMLDGWRVAGGRGYAGDAPIVEQHYRAWRLWRMLGDAPWRPYDGCRS